MFVYNIKSKAVIFCMRTIFHARSAFLQMREIHCSVSGKNRNNKTTWRRNSLRNSVRFWTQSPQQPHCSAWDTFDITKFLGLKINQNISQKSWTYQYWKLTNLSSWSRIPKRKLYWMCTSDYNTLKLFL